MCFEHLILLLVVIFVVGFNYAQIGVMNEAHKQGGHYTPEEGRQTVDPHEVLVNLTLLTQRVHITHLVCRLSNAKGWVETTP